MKRLASLVALLTGTAGAAEFLRSPEAMVMAFVADYAAWNQRANARTKSGYSEEAMEESERDYGAVIAKFCRPGFKHQPITYGDQSMHEPTLEVIVAVNTQGHKSLVRTKYTRKHAHGEFVADFEYHLSSDGKRWYLESVLYVDSKGKYEGL